MMLASSIFPSFKSLKLKSLSRIVNFGGSTVGVSALFVILAFTGSFDLCENAKGVRIKLDVEKIKFIPVQSSTVPSGKSKLMLVFISFVSFGSKDIPSGTFIIISLLLFILGGITSLFPNVYTNFVLSEPLGFFNC